MSSEIVNVGVAGLGRAGWSLHALSIEQLPTKFRVAAVSDPEPSRREEAVKRFGCRAYAAFDEMLADEGVELVAVAAPSHLHEPYAIAAMRAGKHVLCEKPFATSLEGADRMIAVGKETGRIITSSQNYRYAADFRRVREILESGALGRVLYIRMLIQRFSRRWDWQTLKELGGGELNNTSSHLIDSGLLLFGDAEPQVFCHMERTPLSSGDAEDHVKVLIKGKNAPVLDIEATMACAYPQDKWLVYGTEGGLRGSGDRLHWKRVDFSAMPERPVDRRPTPDRSYNREDLPWEEHVEEIPSEPWLMRNMLVYEGLHKTLRGGAPLEITPESVRRQIWVLEECRRQSAG